MRGTRGGLLALAVGLATLALLGQNGGAATTPSALLLDPVGAFSAPTYIASPPGDTSRLVVVEQAGKIQLVLNGVVQATPFLDIHLLVSYDGNERGLFSIAFAPDYATSGLFYVYYTSTVGPGNIQVDEFKRDASDPNIADPSTRRSVLTIPHSTQSNHNGGQLQFGPDGMLYIGTGDGGGGGDPYRAAQNLQVLRGKILRIDPRQDGGRSVHGARQQSVRRPAAVEAGDLVLRPAEPLALLVRPRHRPTSTSATSVRTPTRRSTTGRSSVGWGRGVNFGWICCEGRHLVRRRTATRRRRTIVAPVLEYTHSGRRHARSPADTSSRTRKSRASSAGTSTATTATGRSTRTSFTIPDAQGDAPTGLDAGNTTSFGEDSCGHVYVAGQCGSPNVWRIRQTNPPGRSSASRGTTCPF